MPRIFKFLSIFALSLFLVNSAFADTIEDKAREFISNIGKEVVASLAKNETTEAEKEKILNDLFNKNFDVNFISRFVLGRYARTATEKQFSEFKQSFQTYIITLYVKQFSNYTGETFEVGRSRRIKKGSIIYAQILSSKKSPVDLVFVVNANKEPYKIADVFVEGISMLLTLRDEYTSFLGQHDGDIDELIRQLKDRTKKLKS